MVKCQETACQSEASYGFRFAESIYCRPHGLEKGAKTQYQVCKCGASTPRFKAPEDERPSCCAKCKTKEMVNVADRRCKCSAHLPTYGMPDDTRAEYCSECKKEGMINLKDKHKKCICKRVIPSFGFPGDKKATCCVECKQDGMINLILDLCPCGKSAVFGFQGDKKPTYCMTCSKEGMVNIITKKCKCGKAVPTFGLQTDKVARYCLSCKTEEMVNICAKRCKCGKSQPVFGLSDDMIPTCCGKCRTNDMIDLRSAKCKCGSVQPSFGLITDEKPSCCVECKSDEMINIRAKKCKCGKSQPFYGLPNDKIPSCCAKCKESQMIDIMSSKSINRICKGTPELQTMGLKCPYNQHGKKKYDYYCTACFQQNFPSDPRTTNIRGKTKEIAVRTFLQETFPEHQFIHDKVLWTGEEDCSCRRRIDFRCLFGNTLLCIEVDEDQHKYRKQDDEDIRYDDLMMLHGGKFVFIRFNPDTYKNAKGIRKNPPIEKRFGTLNQAIREQIKRIQSEQNTELVEIVRLFFDEV
jgi:hypothetical protein